MAGISSQAAGKLENKLKANGGDELQHKEFSDGSGLEEYDAVNRMYDPQIGRFGQIDRLCQYMRRWSPYAFGFDNPVTYNDPLGLSGTDSAKNIPPPKFPPGVTPAPAPKPSADEWTGPHDDLAPVSVRTVTKPSDTQPHYDLSLPGWFKTMISFVPFVGNLYQVVDGIATGNYMEVGLGVAGLAIDAFTLGEGGEALSAGENLIEDAVAVGAEDEIKDGGMAELEDMGGGGDDPLAEYDVGTYDELKAKSTTGDGLDIHHAPQAKPASQVISGYDRATGPAIALREAEHGAIPTLKGANVAGNARQQLAKDIWDLRRHTGAPTSSLQKLVNLTKTMYPASFIK